MNSNLEELKAYAKKMLGVLSKNEPGDPVHIPTSKFEWLCNSIVNLENDCHEEVLEDKPVKLTKKPTKYTNSFLVLEAIQNGNRTPSSMHACIGISPQAIYNTLSVLKKKGVIVKENNKWAIANPNG